MDNRYNRHNRRKYSLKVHIVLVTKYRPPPYKSTLKAKVNGKKFTWLLPPPKGSGFPPTTKRKDFVYEKCKRSAGNN